MAVKYIRNNKTFINPYTFVPTPKKQPVRREALGEHYNTSLHTGVLQCRLYVRTPLGIPDAVTEEEIGGHRKYRFFSYTEEGKRVLVIPGSALRGTVRSVFEAATDSCFSTLRDNTGLSKRIESRGAYKPGILKRENGEWKLYHAKRYLLAADTMPLGPACGVVERNYSKFAGLPKEVYVNILKQGKDGGRAAVTQQGEELYFGDEVEFRIEEKGRYEKRGFLIWEGAAADIRKQAGNGSPQGGRKRGIVYIGESFGTRKHGESIFMPVREVQDIGNEQLKKAYQGLLETLEMYRNPAVNRSGDKHSGYSGFEHAKKERGIPVWYSLRDAKLSMAAIGRTFYNTTLNELAGERQPCKNRKKLCAACMLFGMTGEENLGSRIRFTDARAGQDYPTEEVTLQILGEPRYSYLPFYVRGEEGDSYDDAGVEIAGRKFYWHNERAQSEPGVYRGAAPGRMNSTLELVGSGAEFAFSIYYDGITEEQLAKLMWCLHFGENEAEGTLCHKFGHGKPLGLGSAKVVVEERAERIFEDGRYEWRHEKPVEAGEVPDIRNRKELEKVMDFHWLEKSGNPDAVIRYPEVYDVGGKAFPKDGGNEGAGHIWYMKNREKPGAYNDNDRVERLPDILAENQELHGYEKVGGDFGGGGYRGSNGYNRTGGNKESGRYSGSNSYKGSKHYSGNSGNERSNSYRGNRGGNRN